MVLRSGIIIPFQFRDSKKLLMIGVPEENRNLSIWDLKNVVRAAFGIYNFEFRNKKIGFNIPDELLLHYLAQRHDLTNFVIEIGQAHDDEMLLGSKDPMSFEPSCSQRLSVALPQKSNDSMNDIHINNYVSMVPHVKSPLDSVTNHSDHSSNQEPPHKMRISNVYSEHTAEELAPNTLDGMDIIPKSEHTEVDMDTKYSDLNETILHQQTQLQHHSISLKQSPVSPHFYSNYGHSVLVQHSSPLVNRFRKRGERMSKDQKELYVKYFEDNPCMLAQRRNHINLEPHWNKLASLLNSVPQGAVKNVEEWKQTFDAWRYRVFMYTRYNSKLIGPAAQNPKNYKPLTSTDQRAYAMWTSHKHTAPQDFDKIDMFANLEETQTDYDY